MMIGLVLLAATAVQSPKSPVVMPGGYYGGVSCANAWKPKYQQNTRTYVLGLWSGMNLAGSPSVGHSIAQNALLGRISAQCAADPKMILTNATLRVYYSVKQQGL